MLQNSYLAKYGPATQVVFEVSGPEVASDFVRVAVDAAGTSVYVSDCTDTPLVRRYDAAGNPGWIADLGSVVAGDSWPVAIAPASNGDLAALMYTGEVALLSADGASNGKLEPPIADPSLFALSAGYDASSNLYLGFRDGGDALAVALDAAGTMSWSTAIDLGAAQPSQNVSLAVAGEVLVAGGQRVVSLDKSSGSRFGRWTWLRWERRRTS